jgi:hypothetical protein
MSHPVVSSTTPRLPTLALLISPLPTSLFRSNGIPRAIATACRTSPDVAVVVPRRAALGWLGACEWLLWRVDCLYRLTRKALDPDAAVAVEGDASDDSTDTLCSVLQKDRITVLRELLVRTRACTRVHCVHVPTRARSTPCVATCLAAPVV